MVIVSDQHRLEITIHFEVIINMQLKDQIINDMKMAMKNGHKTELDTIRSIRAAILEFEKSGIDRDMTENDEITLLAQLAKKRRDSIDMYQKAGREDLAEKEKQELEIINRYLPKQLSIEEIETIVDAEIATHGFNGAEDMGRLMGKVIPRTKGKADGKIVQSIVKDRLNKQ